MDESDIQRWLYVTNCIEKEESNKDVCAQYYRQLLGKVYEWKATDQIPDQIAESLNESLFEQYSRLRDYNTTSIDAFQNLTVDDDLLGELLSHFSSNTAFESSYDMDKDKPVAIFKNCPDGKNPFYG
ncbi:unnamed protein product, partial [Didymodactylos carnosus]